MTRARDSLTIYAKQGTGKDPSPPGFLRDLLKDPSLLGRWLVPAQPRGFQTDMFAEAADRRDDPRQRMALPAACCRPVGEAERQRGADLRNLSATVQAGARMEDSRRSSRRHAVWRSHPSRPARLLQLGPRPSARWRTRRLSNSFAMNSLPPAFRTATSMTSTAEQGVLQLQDFLAAFRRSPVAQGPPHRRVFRCEGGRVKVVGRIDRIDEDAGGGVVITDYKTGKGAIAGRFRREPATFHLRPGGAREVGISRRSPGPLQPGR